jgi:hypothetical protein
MRDSLTTVSAVGALLFGIAAAVVPRMVTAEVLSRAAKGTIVQEAPSTRPGETVSSSDVEKYVAVYDAMHRNRKLTLQEAAANQNLSVPAFRDLERKVEQNPAALAQARSELMNRAEHSNPPSLGNPETSRTH